MKKNRIPIVIIFSICFLVISIFLWNRYNPDVTVPVVSYEVEDITELTTQEKVEDFLYLYEILESSYPYFGILERTKGTNWLENRDDYIQKIENTENNLQYYNQLSSILMELHQCHTNIIHPRNYDYYLESSDGRYMRPWKQVLSHETVRERYNYWKKLHNVSPRKESVREIAEANRRGNVTHRIIEEDKIAYMKVNSLNFLFTEGDGRDILAFYKSIKDYPNLIIDIRGNGGGSSQYWEDNIVKPLLQKPLTEETINVFRNSDYLSPFINSRVQKFSTIEILPEKANYPKEVEEKEMFSHYFSSSRKISPKNSVGYKGKIYLLVDGGVYSSSEGLAVFAKSTDWATLVGTKTGGDGIGFDPILVSLPYSGLIIRFPGTMGLISDGSANEENQTMPHVLINPAKSEDALEKTLEIIMKAQE